MIAEAISTNNGTGSSAQRINGLRKLFAHKAGAAPKGPLMPTSQIKRHAARGVAAPDLSPLLNAYD